MSGTRMRPNANPILNMMRDGDTADAWGLAMGWAYAGAEVLYDADPYMVPVGLQYQPSIVGPEVPNGGAEPYRITLTDLPYETVEVWCWLHGVNPGDPKASEPDELPYWSDDEFRGRAGELVTALKCLDRYLDWCRAAGRDY